MVIEVVELMAEMSFVVAPLHMGRQYMHNEAWFHNVWFSSGILIERKMLGTKNIKWKEEAIF